MKDGTIVKQRDIFLAPFPYSDLSEIKQRPVLVLSCKEYLIKNQDFLCCILTSSKKNFYRGIKIENSDLEIGKLQFETVAIPSKIFSLHKKSVIKKIGKASKSKTKEITNKILEEIKIN